MHDNMLILNQSNRFEILLHIFCQNLAEHPSSVFSQEQVIVSSAAAKRKLTLAIADVYGICANITFSFLAQWLWQQVRQLVNVGKTSPFSSSILSWRILRFFEAPNFTKTYPRLDAYLARSDDIMRFELACRVAALFEHYALYRPEWLTTWSKGKTVSILPHDHPKHTMAKEDQAWQAALWQEIAKETGIIEHDPVTLFFTLLNKENKKALAQLPKRVHLFCEPSLAPQHIEMLRQLGQWIDIELYVLNPCREYWFDIVDRKRLAWLANRQQDIYHETGNSLLAFWGKPSQASLDLMLTQLQPFAQENNRFISASEAGQPQTVLTHVQDAILDLVELEPGSLSHFNSDGSIEIHVAHSLIREIEILHDQLLRRFASDPSSAPANILVVMPNLDEASPIIEAVFNHNDPKTRIPYVITGSKGLRINPIARALLDLLALATSRFLAADVIDVLTLPEIGTTFGFNNDNLSRLRRWLDNAGIYWALDGSHKAEFNLPEDDRYSFHDGLHKLFLAYALPDEKHMPFAGRLPAGHVSGTFATELAQLWQFIEIIRQLKHQLSSSKTPKDWMQCWLTTLDTFVTVTPETQDADHEVRTQITSLRDMMEEASDTFETNFTIARYALERALEGAGQGSIPSGAVTFAPIENLRGLPFDHIFAIGLNDGVFPADTRPEEFNLIQLAPRKNDPSLRDTDKNVFLDLVLSARKSLYLSYSGKSIRDNSVKPPSILIAELLDVLLPALAKNTNEKSIQKAYEQLVTEHPLQPFSVNYFNKKKGERMVSFRSDLCHALNERKKKIIQKESLITHQAQSDFINDDQDDNIMLYAGLPFFTGCRNSPEVSWRHVSLDELIRFFHHPIRYFIQRRLGINFPFSEKELPTDEPFVMDENARKKLADRLLPLYLEHVSLDKIEKVAMAGNEYPSGHLGATCLKNELMALSVYAKNLSADLESDILEPVNRTLEFDLDGENWQLSGSLTNMRKNGLVQYWYKNASPVDFLEGWIKHLFLSICSPQESTCRSIWHFKNEKIELDPVDNALPLLCDLITIYRMGLNTPLHFFPFPAWEYVSNNNNMSKAQEKYSKNHNAFNYLAMRGIDNPLDNTFIDLAQRVFGSFIAHRTKDEHRAKK